MLRNRLVYHLLFLLIFFISCSAPSIESEGGAKFSIQCNTDVLESTKSLLETRFAAISESPQHIKSSVENDLIHFELPAVTDSSAVRQLVEWDREFRLCRGLDPSVLERVRMALAEYISIPEKKKPYKPGSMIGLVSDNQRQSILDLIDSESFKSAFPEVRNHYWGVKKMDGKSALFMEASSSAFITGEMFEDLQGFASQDETEGVFSLQLKGDYSDRIGNLTGNDSTYLLHIFHDEVYISKIIVPHITQTNFGMSGAFSIMDAKILGALWASEDLDESVKLTKIELVKKP